MGAAVHIKAAMLYKGVKQKEFSKDIGKDSQVFYNMLSRDTFRWAEVEKIADALGCDVMLVDRVTGKTY